MDDIAHMCKNKDSSLSEYVSCSSPVFPKTHKPLNTSATSCHVTCNPRLNPVIKPFIYTERIESSNISQLVVQAHTVSIDELQTGLNPSAATFIPSDNYPSYSLNMNIDYPILMENLTTNSGSPDVNLQLGELPYINVSISSNSGHSVAPHLATYLTHSPSKVSDTDASVRANS